MSQLYDSDCGIHINTNVTVMVTMNVTVIRLRMSQLHDPGPLGPGPLGPGLTRPYAHNQPFTDDNSPNFHFLQISAIFMKKLVVGPSLKCL